MSAETLFEILADIDDTYILEARAPLRQPVWRKWAALAACLCLVLAAALTLPRLLRPTPAAQDAQPLAHAPLRIAETPNLVYLAGVLYRDTGTLASPDGVTPDGVITASVDGAPTEDGQSNFGAGCAYCFRSDGTVLVEMDDGWHIFVSDAAAP